MGDYLTVQWVSEAPTSRGIGWSNVVFLASGSVPASASNPQLVSASNYASYISSTSYEYIALGSYYKQFPGSPTNQTYVYWMGANAGTTGLLKGTGYEYTLPFPPYATIDNIQVDPTGGANWQEIAAYNETTCPSGYIAYTGVGGSYDGRIYFDADVADGGPYFESGGVTYSGQIARDIVSVSGGLLRGLVTQNGFGIASQDLKEYDIQFIVPLYNTAGNGTGLMNTPAWGDLLNGLIMAAGNRKMVVWALPKAGAPNTEYPGTNYDYNQFRKFVGQNQNAIVTYMDVATGTTSTGLDDPAAVIAGKICSLHPHETLTLKTVAVSLASRADLQDKEAWDAGHIICVFNKSDLKFSADQLNYGYTFSGTSPSDRISNVRCKYIVEFNVLADLWSLLSSGKVRITPAGLRLIIDVTNATLNRLLSQGIIDRDTPSAKRQVDIPLLYGTATEWTWANTNRKVPAMKVRWPWANNAEGIDITEFGEVM